MRIAITGRSGQVGSALCKLCPAHWQLHAMGRAELDLDKPESIESAIRRVSPQVIVNAAGYTAVDRAEQEPELAMRINGESVGVLANVARQCGAALIHLSTDYIFDGLQRTPYTPADQPNPQSVYAQSKLLGESAVRESGCTHVILRTQWVYGLTGRNFALAILKQAACGKTMRIVHDQVGSPTWAQAIAQAIVRIVETGVSGREGTYHLSCAGSTTWFEFAQSIVGHARQCVPNLPEPTITPITAAEYAAPAARPAYSVLDCTTTQQTFGIALPHWRDALQQAMSDCRTVRKIVETARATAQ